MDVLFAGVMVQDLTRAVDWYSRFFGRAPDIVPHDQEVMWKVSDGGWLYLLQEPRASAGSLVTIAVSDLHAELAALRRRRIDFGPVEGIGTKAVKATGSDPEGNAVALIQVAPTG